MGKGVSFFQYVIVFVWLPVGALVGASDMHVANRESYNDGIAMSHCERIVDFDHKPWKQSRSLLVYNRLNKCGSSTMLELTHDLWARRRNQVKLVDETGAALKYLFIDVGRNGEGYQPLQPFVSNTPYTKLWTHLGCVAERGTACGSRHIGGEHSKPNATHQQYDALTRQSRAIYVNHMLFPNFTDAGYAHPIFIQIMRETVAREVSTFYYRTHGPRPRHKMERQQQAEMAWTGLSRLASINEFYTMYERRYGVGCANRLDGFENPEDAQRLNLQTRYFCGFDPVCDDICSDAAYERAERVLTHHYAVVGVLEHLEKSLQLLEKMLPTWFDGMTAMYRSSMQKQRLKNTNATDSNTAGVHNRVTKGANEKPTESTQKIIRSLNRQDVKLYSVALTLLRSKLRVCGLDDDDNL
eukprot:m.174708 g.174708  ORF g.174708 m.174708 type:complete len:412 (+) comp31781_c0_seq1:296-1531(+)